MRFINYHHLLFQVCNGSFNCTSSWLFNKRESKNDTIHIRTLQYLRVQTKSQMNMSNEQVNLKMEYGAANIGVHQCTSPSTIFDPAFLLSSGPKQYRTFKILLSDLLFIENNLTLKMLITSIAVFSPLIWTQISIKFARLSYTLIQFVLLLVHNYVGNLFPSKVVDHDSETQLSSGQQFQF